MGSRWLIVLALVGGCRTRGPGAPAGDAAPDTPVALTTLATRIDPGDTGPLTASRPDWLERVLADQHYPGTSEPADVRERADEFSRAFTVSPAYANQLLALLDALIRLEQQATCSADCLATMERLLYALDNPILVDESSELFKVTELAADLAPSGAVSAQGRALVAFVGTVVSGARARHRHVAARLFREAPEGPGTLAALHSLAARAGSDEDHATAASLYATSMPLAPAPERDLVAIAASCYRALAIACGDRRLAELRKTKIDAPSLHSVETDAVTARRVRELSGSKEFAERVELGHALITLQRRNQARTVFEALRTERPGDARPLAGLAHASWDLAKVETARDYLRDAAGLSDRDRHYYEMVVGLAYPEVLRAVQAGMQGVAMSATVTEPLREVRENIAGLARFVPGRAAVLTTALDASDRLIPLLAKGDTAAVNAALREILTAAAARMPELQRTYPDEVDVQQLAIFLANFDTMPRVERERIFTAPADTLSEKRAGSYFTVIVAERWTDKLAAFATSLAALESTPGVENLRADTAAVGATIAGTGWDAALARYEKLLADAPVADRPRLDNNRGVALYHLGRADEARRAWDAAVAAGGGELPAVPRINQLAASPTPTLAQVDAIVPLVERPGIKYQLDHWRRSVETRGGKPASFSVEQIQRALDDSNAVQRVADGSLGVVLDGSLSISFGFSSTRGLVIELVISSKTWLVIPAPGTAAPGTAAP